MKLNIFIFGPRQTDTPVKGIVLVVSVFTDFLLILFLAQNYSVLYKQKIKNVTKFIEKTKINKYKNERKDKRSLPPIRDFLT